MKNLQKEKRNRLILIVAGTLGCMLAIWFGLVRAQNKGLENIATKTIEQQNKVGNAARLIGSTTEIQMKLEAAAEKLHAIETGMASGDLYSWMIMTVNKFRAGHRVDIPQFSREVPTEVGVLPKFPYKAALFNVRGTAYFHDLGTFLADFENNFQDLRVQNLELEPAAGSRSHSTCGPGDQA